MRTVNHDININHDMEGPIVLIIKQIPIIVISEDEDILRKAFHDHIRTVVIVVTLVDHVGLDRVVTVGVAADQGVMDTGQDHDHITRMVAGQMVIIKVAQVIRAIDRDQMHMVIMGGIQINNFKDQVMAMVVDMVVVVVVVDHIKVAMVGLTLVVGLIEGIANGAEKKENTRLRVVF